jgi:glycerate kinase
LPPRSGAGALAALRARFLGVTGKELPAGGIGLTELAQVALGDLRPPPAGGAECLTDVRAPLLGCHGAAAVFGSQKGASASEISRLELGLTRLAEPAGGQPGEPGSGAAGGTGYGLAIWGAHLRPGAVRIAEIAGLPWRLTARVL